MLRVVQPFDGRAVGDEITDAEKIETILASEHAAFVVRVPDPVDAEPAQLPARKE